MADSFVLICEVGLNNFTVERFGGESEARAKAAKYWCCWVLFRSNATGTELPELATGGVGFSHPNIRTYAQQNIKSKARDADARAAAAAAAEARAAKMAASAPKPKPKPAGSLGDGRPDVSNAAAWD